MTELGWVKPVGLHVAFPVALGFSQHGCWVSRASLPRGKVLEKKTCKKTGPKLQDFFWPGAEVSCKVLLIQLHSTCYKQSLSAAQMQGEGNYLQASMGLRQGHVAEEHVGGRYHCGHLWNCRLPHAQRPTEGNSGLIPHEELQGSGLFIPTYPFVIDLRLPLGEHKFPVTSVSLWVQTEQTLAGWGQPCDNACDRDTGAGPWDWKQCGNRCA